jgi:hypothetical protein
MDDPLGVFPDVRESTQVRIRRWGTVHLITRSATLGTAPLEPSYICA